MKKVLIIGGTGMLGHKLVQILGERLEVWTTVHRGLDQLDRFGIFDPDRTIENVDVNEISSVRRAIARAEPDVVINAVGVVKQLPESSDVVHTLMINSIFPHRLAELSAEIGFRLIHISTDCVFDGRTGNYDEGHAPDALDLYGQSKHFGEVTGKNCLTLRTSIIGRELSGTHSLVEWFLSNRGKTVKGFVNAIYSGFPTIVFADIISSLITDHAALNGLYHVASEPIDKFKLLKLINDAYEAGITVEPDEEFRIDRSLDPRRFLKATGLGQQSWKIMIERMAADPTPYDELRR